MTDLQVEDGVDRVCLFVCLFVCLHSSPFFFFFLCRSLCCVPLTDGRMHTLQEGKPCKVSKESRQPVERVKEENYMFKLSAFQGVPFPFPVHFFPCVLM